jgi:hypothetical protein
MTTTKQLLDFHLWVVLCNKLPDKDRQRALDSFDAVKQSLEIKRTKDGGYEIDIVPRADGQSV